MKTFLCGNVQLYVSSVQQLNEGVSLLSVIRPKCTVRDRDNGRPSADCIQRVEGLLLCIVQQSIEYFRAAVCCVLAICLSCVFWVFLLPPTCCVAHLRRMYGGQGPI